MVFGGFNICGLNTELIYKLSSVIEALCIHQQYLDLILKTSLTPNIVSLCRTGFKGQTLGESQSKLVSNCDLISCIRLSVAPGFISAMTTSLIPQCFRTRSSIGPNPPPCCVLVCSCFYRVSLIIIEGKVKGDVSCTHPSLHYYSGLCWQVSV